MRIFILLVMLGLIVGNQNLISGQTPTQSSLVQRQTEQLKNRPDLGVDYNGVARLKLISRKNTYRQGEMINIDMALINVGAEPLFFRKLEGLNFYASYKNKKEELIVPYILFSRVIRFDSYELVQPNRMINESFQLLSTCDSRAFEQITDPTKDKDDRRAFEDDRFINWGQACFEFKETGTYTIIAEQANQLVINSVAGKTVIGKIRSTPLMITIVN